MPKNISSYSKILLSLLGQKMPELLKYTSEHSANNPSNNLENNPSKLTSPLSSQRIQEAALHPNSIMQQALRVTSGIQKALNDRNAVLDEITQKRDYIKLSLIKLQKNDLTPKDKDDKAGVQKDAKIKELIASLNKELANLMPLEQEVQAAKDKLNQERSELDKTIQACEAQWQQHRELYFKKLEEELEKNSVILNTEEKNELRKGSNNISSIEQKLTNLKKLNIDIKNQDSDFSIVVYDAIMAVLSRELKPVNNKAINNIVEKILTVIKEEENAADIMKKQHASQYEQIITNIHGLKIQETKMEQNLDEKDEALDEIENKIKLISAQK